jgi:hypothetical protein
MSTATTVVAHTRMWNKLDVWGAQGAQRTAVRGLLCLR